jgi:hypothetical protein
MRNCSMQKLAMAAIASFAILGGVGAANAQMHGGFHGGGGFHGHDGFHGGVHHGDAFHDGHHFHGNVFFGAPVFLGPGYYPYAYAYPYDYAYPYADGSVTTYWYCRDPAGYYPGVQSCPSGWMQVIPNGAAPPDAAQ